MCSGRVEPQLVLKALQEGADGVLIAGCKSGECHYRDGNEVALRRFYLLRQLLDQFGIDPERLQMAGIAAADGRELVELIDDLGRRLHKLEDSTPLPASGSAPSPGRE